MNRYISRHLSQDVVRLCRKNPESDGPLDCAEVATVFREHSHRLFPARAVRTSDLDAAGLLNQLDLISQLRNRFAHDTHIGSEVRLDDLLNSVDTVVRTIGDTRCLRNMQELRSQYASAEMMDGLSRLALLSDVVSIPAAFINGSVLEFYLPHARQYVATHLRSHYGDSWFSIAVLPHILDEGEKHRITELLDRDIQPEHLLDPGGIIAALNDSNGHSFTDIRQLRGRAQHIASARNDLWHSQRSSSSDLQAELCDQTDRLVVSCAWILEHIGHHSAADELKSLWERFDPRRKEERRRIAESWSLADTSWRDRKLNVRRQISWVSTFAGLVAVVCLGTVHQWQLVEQRWLVTGGWLLIAFAFAMSGPLWKFRIFAPGTPVGLMCIIPDSLHDSMPVEALTDYVPDSVHAVLYFALWMSLLRLSVATVFNRENGARIRGAQQNAWEDPEAMVAFHRVRTMLPALNGLIERRDPDLRAVSRVLSFAPMCIAVGSASATAVILHIVGLRPVNNGDAYWLLIAAAAVFSSQGILTLWFARSVIHKLEPERFLVSAAPFLVFLAGSYFVLTEVFFTPHELWVGDWRQWHHWR